MLAVHLAEGIGQEFQACAVGVAEVQRGAAFLQGGHPGRGQPAVLGFDPGSLVLTAFGRVNAGTISGDRKVADTFLNSFFRI